MKKMFDTNLIEKMSKEDKMSLIEYLESLPDNIDSFVKMNLNTDYLDPSLYNGKRKIYPSCTLRNYFKKKPLDGEEIEIISNPKNSMYQPKFCVLDHAVENSKFSQTEKLFLMTILKAKSYSEIDLINIEITIGEYLRNNIYAPIELIQFLMDKILPYKFEAYDFFVYLQNKYNLDISNETKDDFNYMKNLNDTILILIRHHLFDFGSYKNIAILLYVYFFNLRIEDKADKYNLLERFRFYISDGMSFNEIKDNYETLILSEDSLSEILSTIVNPERIGSIFSKLSKSNTRVNINDIFNKDYPSGHFIKEGNIILCSENSFMFENDIAMLAAIIPTINNEEIAKYTSNCDDPNMIKTYFFDNDLGHLSNFDDFSLATVYNSLIQEMYYICKYKSKYYVLFKLISDANTIYGLELSDNKDEKNIINFTMDKNIKYKLVYGY